MKYRQDLNGDTPDKQIFYVGMCWLSAISLFMAIFWQSWRAVSLLTSQSRGRRCRRGTRKVTKPCGRIYGCHMELRQQNNGFNVEDHPPYPPPTLWCTPPRSLLMTHCPHAQRTEHLDAHIHLYQDRTYWQEVEKPSLPVWLCEDVHVSVNSEPLFTSFVFKKHHWGCLVAVYFSMHW